MSKASTKAKAKPSTQRVHALDPGVVGIFLEGIGKRNV